jgi:hypothetical protein
MATARRSLQTTDITEELARLECDLVQLVVSVVQHDPRWLEGAF